MKLMFDRLNATLEHAMDLRLERGNMISANIANVDTPDYTPVNITFDQQLTDYLAGQNPGSVAKTNAAHMGTSSLGPRGEVEFDYFSLPNEDGNSVDIDHEMSKLAENQLLYRATTKMYSKRVALMKYAITEG
ncbi:MAG: flagellar basal body rod protein FlgB [Bradymonadia bacterium]